MFIQKKKVSDVRTVDLECELKYSFYSILINSAYKKVSDEIYIG